MTAQALSWPKAGHWNRALVNSSSNVLDASTNYYVYLADGTTQAPIYTDKARTSTRTQPLVTDLSGNAEFFTEPYMGLVLTIGSNSEAVDVYPDPLDIAGQFFSDGGSHTTYLMSGADNLKRLGFLAGGTSSSALTITVPNDLPKDWQCEIYQEGLGTITYVAASGAVLEAFNVTSTTTMHHPGWKAWTQLTCRFNNGSGNGAVVIIGNGTT